ncbi:MAG: DEAD/DEAH box helicase [Thermodesulfobacteriota bacterium]|nr:DEAD/DEAH box helicase [Thermodesulfobacteriota bacterium]
MEQFINLGISKTMLKTLAKKGFDKPTPIQNKVIPFLLNDDQDLVAQAETGTGKTAAFGIPIIERLDARDKKVKTLILVPTRELAHQVAGEVESLMGSRNLQILPVYGGQAFGPQLRSLKQGVDIVVGTPGRILDHLRRGTLCLDSLSYLVLDEADLMLDMGFIEDIRTILSHAPQERRTMLFSATMPAAVINIARQYMRGYKTLAMNSKPQAVQLTEQVYFEVRDQDKFEALCRVIDMEPEFFGLVFCRTRVDTAEIASRLVRKGYAADGIHGDISQVERERIMRGFREKEISILVATDVAARGIDINNLSHVINYDMPQDPDAYIHRIGRTGRAGRKGTAISFVTSRERRCLEIIKRTAGKAMLRGHIPGVGEVIAAKRDKIRFKIEQAITDDKTGLYADLATELLEKGNTPRVLSACMRLAFADELDTSSYGEIRQINPVANKSRTKLFIARGRKHGITPPKLVKLIRGQTGVSEHLVQDIRIFDDFSYLSVPFAEAAIIQKKFRRKSGQPIVVKAKSEKGQTLRRKAKQGNNRKTSGRNKPNQGRRAAG